MSWSIQQPAKSALPGVAWPGIAHAADVHVLSLLFQIEQSQWWDLDRIRRHQLRQISNLARFARKFSRFYVDHYRGLPEFSSRDLTWDEFQRLPVLRRENLYEQRDELRSAPLPPGHETVGSVATSGSTGAPIDVAVTLITSLMYRTLGLRSHIWQRRDLAAGNMTVRFAKRGQPKIAENSAWAACFQTGPGATYCATLPIEQLFDALMERQPQYLQAYPNIIAGLLDCSQQHGRTPSQLREVRTFGAVLDPDLRARCQQAWNVSVTENYSAMETGILALQCPDCENLHVQEESVLLEIVDEQGKPCAPGEVGRVQVTVLHNLATPMIRYRMGDFAEVGQSCPCGRGLATLRRIVGRDMHLFTMPDGVKKIPNVRASEFNQIAPVRQFQIVQRSLTHIDVHLATTRPLSDVEEQGLRAHLQANLHCDMQYVFHYHDRLERSANGKFEMLRSEVK